MSILKHCVISLLILSSLSSFCSEGAQVKRLHSYARDRLSQEVIHNLEKQAAPHTDQQIFLSNQQPLLFEEFPALPSKISYLSLADLPTPIIHCKQFGKSVGALNLYIKDDGKTGRYTGTKRCIGGNKVRKLEFLLADALAHDAQAVVTFGCAGSNHALATAAYAHQLGLKAFAMLQDQPNSAIVQRNLLLQVHYNTQLIYGQTGTEVFQNTAKLFQDEKDSVGKFPYIIRVGGSMPLGVLGYVNAVFELKHQIQQGLVPEPKVIFVAAGTGGTAAGILLGMQLTKLPSKLVVIHIEPESKPHEMKATIEKLFNETSSLLHAHDKEIPHYEFPQEQCKVLRTFGGKDYGEPTNEGIRVAEQLLNDEDIPLDPTYTAKAAAGMCSYINEHMLQKDTLLFWNTFCGEDYSHLTSTSDYRSLPEPYQKYFDD